MRTVKESYGMGGYKANDPMSIGYPYLLTWLVKKFKVESALDVGCAEGHVLKFLEALGVKDVIGIDGSATAIRRSLNMTLKAPRKLWGFNPCR